MSFEGLAWGNVTPELYNGKDNIAIHVFNHSLEEDAVIPMNILFAKSRFDWYGRHLPKGCKQILIFDTRGQTIKNSTYEHIKYGLAKYGVHMQFKRDGV